MTTDLHFSGLRTGARWAREYATGTKADRREIRRKLARMVEHGQHSPFCRGLIEGFEVVTSDWSRAILSGRRARTCNPFKLARVIDRI